MTGVPERMQRIVLRRRPDGWVTWDDVYLYFAFIVADDIHAQTQSGDLAFRGDSLELQIDTARAGDFGPSLSPDDFQVSLSPGDFGALPWMGPIIAALLEDGLARGVRDLEVGGIIAKMRPLRCGFLPVGGQAVDPNAAARVMLSHCFYALKIS